jgi:hypothetical protein
MPIGKKPKSNQIDTFLAGGLSKENIGKIQTEGREKEKPVIIRLPPSIVELMSEALEISREDNPKQSQHQWILAALSRESKRQIAKKKEENN